jgi:dipeptidyl aminopeptidase/acylaminoacyl peptidase
MTISAIRSGGFSVVAAMVLALAPATFAEDAEQGSEAPDFKAVLSLESAGSPRIAPDGGNIVYSVGSTDWDNNRFDSELWIARANGGVFQLTRTADGSSRGARWSPDGARIAFTADRGNGDQIWLISPDGGEARPLTAVDGGVSSYEWSPDGLQLAVSIADPEGDDETKRDESYGSFAVEDDDFTMTHLWVLNVARALEDPAGAALPDEADEGEEGEHGESGEGEDDETAPPAFRRLTAGDDLTVDSFRWAPNGEMIAFDHTPDPRIESRSQADISVVAVADGTVRSLISQPGPDSDPHWSPDGTWLVFRTSDGEPAYYLNSELARIRVAGGEPEVLTESFDENPIPMGWFEDGIRFIALERTSRRLYTLDPDSRTIREVAIPGAPSVLWNASFSSNGESMAFQAEGPESLDEIYRVDGRGGGAVRVTEMTGQISGWPTGGRELIRWTSEDGVEIEGVLLTPEDFDPTAKHPLMVIIHGGPAWLSFPSPVYSSVYPVQQWLEKGAVVLMPNYRGSAGYGEAFRSLNVRNLGVGDAWDVLSGVDHLIDQGFIDTERMAAMGWSQGGYISAFLTTTTDRFAAISVGAGISNWMTYYVNTDIHPFTRHYLEGTPWNDPEVYAKTSPMTYIKTASTPTLIQHGEFDRRVPTPNAYELYQGLQDVGVDVKLVIYKGFGHGISKPKERLAAVWHNWAFFASRIWGEEVELPLD